MTFSPSDYHFWHKEYPQFTQWAMQRGALFLPRETAEEQDNQYDLTSKAYILMKRLGQDYSRIMCMDSEERDKIFRMEMDLIRKEQKQNEEK